MSSPSKLTTLFDAARADAPSAEAREEVWGRIAVTTGVAAGAATALAAKAGTATATATTVFAASSASKAIGLGALVAAAATAVAMALTLSGTGDDAVESKRQPAKAASRIHVVAGGLRIADEPPRPRDRAQTAPPDARGLSHDRTAVTAKAAVEDADDDAWPEQGNDLATEARLVTEARAALVAGDAIRALALVREARKLVTRSLEPEELGLEARALRAQGRTDEALATELALKRRFPGHALAR